MTGDESAEPDLMVEGHKHEILKSGVVTNSIAGDKGGVSVLLAQTAGRFNFLFSIFVPQKVVVDLPAPTSARRWLFQHQ